MDKAAFGARVRDARRKAKLTSDRAAELCDCTPVSIRQIESGIRLPSLPKLVSLCNALNVTPNELLGPELTFELDQAVDHHSDQRMIEMIVRLHQLSPDKANVVYSMLETLLNHIECLD